MTDQELLDGLWQQNEAAFGELYNNLFRKFCAFAKGLVNDPIEAGDQTSEAFIKLWVSQKRFSTMDHLNDFLYKVIRNSCISYIRKNKLQVKFERQLIESGKVTEDIIEKKLQEADVYNKIYSRIDFLPEMRKKVIRLTYIQGLSRAEVAEQLGISESTVKNQITEALKTIRLYIGPARLVVLFLLIYRLLSH